MNPEINHDKITLASIRQWAEDHQTFAAPGGSDFSKGFDLAVADVLAILKVHDRPPYEPVVFRRIDDL